MPVVPIRTALPAAAGALAAAVALAAAPPAPAAARSHTGTGCSTTPAGTTPRPWAQQRLQPERVWPLTRGDGILVAVVDSGVDVRNPHLRGQVEPGPDLLTPRRGTTRDCSGHGTLVAGLIVGRPLPGTPFAGVAPDARVLSIRQNERLGATVLGDAAGMARAIRAAVDAGADVINISATTPRPTEALADAVAYATTNDVVVVAAAGNDDPERTEPGAGAPSYYPAAFPDVLAVAGTDRQDRRTDTSHAGTYVDVAAPGADITSTGPNGPGRYAVVTGTSFAAPLVAGTAALVRAYRPDLTAEQVVARIVATADPPASRADAALVGAGVVNPYAAVTAVLPGEEVAARPQAITRASAGTPDLLPVVAAREPRPDERRATWTAGGALVAALLAIAVAAAVPPGRRRGWRPGRRGPVATAPPHDPLLDD